MYVFLVCFADLKFAPESIQSAGELQIQHTSRRFTGLTVLRPIPPPRVRGCRQIPAPAGSPRI